MAKIKCKICNLVSKVHKFKGCPNKPCGIQSLLPTDKINECMLEFKNFNPFSDSIIETLTDHINTSYEEFKETGMPTPSHSVNYANWPWAE